MKRWEKRLESTATIMAYAEAGNWEHVREFLGEVQRAWKANSKNRQKRQGERSHISIYRG